MGKFILDHRRMKSAGHSVHMLLENRSYPQDVRVHQETTTLSAADYQVSVICPSRPGQSPREIIDAIRVYRYPAPPAAKGFLGYRWEYGYSMAAIFLVSLRVLLREGFDIVHAHHPLHSFAFIGAFYRLLGKRYVLDHHDLAPKLYYARFGGTGIRIVYRALIALKKFACRVADHVIATNESYKIVELQRGDVPESKITIVRNGPVLNELGYTEWEPILRKKGKVILGYVGVMRAQDGVDNLLRALHHLVYDLVRTNCLCILVGSGNALPGLQSLAQQVNIADYVYFTGWVNHPAEVTR